MKPTQEDLENIAQLCNDGHEGGAVQSTFLEKLKVIIRCRNTIPGKESRKECHQLYFSTYGCMQ
jgi:hypothetical protein